MRLKAAAATTTVLIMGSIAALIATYLLFQSTDRILSSRLSRDAANAEYAANACAEYALEQARTIPGYTGNESITVLAPITCQIDTIQNISGTYTLTTSATVGEATKYVSVVYTKGSTVNVSKWHEVTH